MPKDNDIALDSESDFKTVHESDDETTSSECVVFNPKAIDNPKLKFWMFFNSKRMQVSLFVKQNKIRLRAKCRSEGVTGLFMLKT